MCCLNVPFTIALFYFYINPHVEWDEPLSCKKKLLFPFIMILACITIVLDIVCLPFILITTCCMKYCCKNNKVSEENAENNTIYNVTNNQQGSINMFYNLV
jgi:hypothetical protein